MSMNDPRELSFISGESVEPTDVVDFSFEPDVLMNHIKAHGEGILGVEIPYQGSFLRCVRLAAEPWGTRSIDAQIKVSALDVMFGEMEALKADISADQKETDRIGTAFDVKLAQLQQKMGAR